MEMQTVSLWIVPHLNSPRLCIKSVNPGSQMGTEVVTYKA